MSCAKMGAPPGGPEDKAGPFLVTHYPDLDAVNVQRRMIARLEFSEPVNRASVEAALFLSPDPRQRLRYRWRGNTLELIYLDELDANRTYVITIGSQAKDIRGNPAEQPQTIAFSTGDRIDRGRMEGWVAGVESPQAVSLLAYQLEPDSVIDPMTQEANYRSQPLESGFFEFGYLRSGTYRVFAVLDRDFNGRWNPSAELIGIAPWDVMVTDSTHPWVSFRLAEQDTAPPAIRSVRQVNQRELDLRITVPVDSLQTRIVSASGDSVSTFGNYADLNEPDTWHVFPSSELSPGNWIVLAEGTSRRGVAWSDSEQVEVRSRADTSRPVIARSFPELKRKSRTVPDVLRLEFSEPVLVIDTVAADTIFYSSVERDSGAIAVESKGPRIVDMVPSPGFAEGRSYFIKFDGRLFRDLGGNALADSSIELRFGVLAPDSMGSLRVKLERAPAGQYLMNVFVVKDHVPFDTVVSNPELEFTIAELPAGKYVIEVIRDANNNLGFDYGSVSPLQFSEPFILPPDTFSIRARWEQEVTIAWPENY